MALLYKKYTEGDAIIFDFTTKTRWVILLAMPIGFMLFIGSIKILSFSSAYQLPLFLISLPLLLGSLAFTLVENIIFAADRMQASKATIIKKGAIKLEEQMSQN